MGNNVLVIGNGFDLAHGRKTKYSHFLEWICNPNDAFKKSHPELLAQNAFPSCVDSSIMTFLINIFNAKKSLNSWIDLEEELHTFIRNLNSLIDGLNGEQYKNDRELFLIRARSRNIAETTIINQLVSIFHMEGPDVKLNDEYIDFWRKLDKRMVFETIHYELVDLRKMLEFYLNNVEPLLRDDIKPLDIIKQIKPVYVISFNYTDTIQKYYNIPDERVCYIHGRLNRNNIVLGYDDSDGGLDDLEFKKYYQRLIYSTDRINYGFSIEEDEYGGYHSPDIYFYGHSLDVSDIDILKGLFSKGGRIFIYCKDESDRNDKIKNVIKILGKGPAINRIETGAIQFCIIEPHESS